MMVDNDLELAKREKTLRDAGHAMPEYAGTTSKHPASDNNGPGLCRALFCAQRLSVSTHRVTHVDMDAFFASVEQPRQSGASAASPCSWGVPAGGGVVMAASYEARSLDTRSAMLTAQAPRLCPQAIVVKGGHGKYSAVSRQVFTVVRARSRPMSSRSRSTRRFRSHKRDASARQELESRVRVGREAIEALTAAGAADQTGHPARPWIPASIRVSGNKFLAKVCSDLSKPDGLKILPPREAEQSLLPMPSRCDLWCRSPTQERLRQLGVHHRRISRVRRRPPCHPLRRAGARRSASHGARTTVPSAPAASRNRSARKPFSENIGDPEELYADAALLRGGCRNVRCAKMVSRPGVTPVADRRLPHRSPLPHSMSRRILGLLGRRNGRLLQEWLRESRTRCG